MFFSAAHGAPLVLQTVNVRNDYLVAKYPITFNLSLLPDNEMPFGTVVIINSNKCIKFDFKILSDRSENGKKT